MIVMTSEISGFRDFKRSADYGKRKHDHIIQQSVVNSDSSCSSIEIYNLRQLLFEICNGAIANVSIIVHIYDMSYCGLDLLSTKDG